MNKWSAILGLLFVCTPAAFAADAPASPWSGSIGAGLAITSGNSDTKNTNLSFSTKYDPKTLWLFKADALYLRGESNGTTQVDKATADVREEYTISDRTFAFGEVTYLRDPQAAISYLVAPLAGVGYRILKDDRRTLTVDGAAGAEAESGPAGRTTSGAVKAGENFEFAISPTSKLTQKLTGLWKTNDFADALYHFDIGLATTVTARTELKLAYAYDYRNRPRAIGIKKGDSALFAAFMFKY